jgi:hypothetical protein
MAGLRAAILPAYGQPDANIHAVQLELAQVNYMNEMAPYAYGGKALNFRRCCDPYLRICSTGQIATINNPHTCHEAGTQYPVCLKPNAINPGAIFGILLMSSPH